VPNDDSFIIHPKQHNLLHARVRAQFLHTASDYAHDLTTRRTDTFSTYAEELRPLVAVPADRESALQHTAGHSPQRANPKGQHSGLRHEGAPPGPTARALVRNPTRLDSSSSGKLSASIVPRCARTVT
jgi:phosphotransferase system HPr-like phosphotransfer protein